MPHDLVNRDNAFEKRFAEDSKQTSLENPDIKMLYNIWLDMRSLDLQLAREKRFRTLKSALYFAERVFGEKEGREADYYRYMKWFFFNRLINTGERGHAVCERSPIFVRPKPKRGTLK